MVRSSLIVSALLCSGAHGARIRALDLQKYGDAATEVWVQHGEERTVCKNGWDKKIGSEEECRAKAESAGSTFYSFTTHKGGRCKHGTKCKLRYGTKWNWMTYKLEEVATTPEPFATEEPVVETTEEEPEVESTEEESEETTNKDQEETTEEPEVETTEEEPEVEAAEEETEETTEDSEVEATEEEPEETTEEDQEETAEEEPQAETIWVKHPPAGGRDEPVPEATQEEPEVETTTEEPEVATTTTRATTLPPTTTERAFEPAASKYIFGAANTNGCASGVPFESAAACRAAAEERGYGFLGEIFTPARPAGCYRSGQTVAFNKHPTGMASSICEPMCVNPTAGEDEEDLPVGACCVCKGVDQGFKQIMMVGEEGKAVAECQEECEEYCEEEGAVFHSCVDAKGVLALRESLGVHVDWEESGEMCDWPSVGYDGSA